MSESKCFIVIRSDLDMPEGKFGAQVGHAIDNVWTEVMVAGTMVRGANAANEKPKQEHVDIMDKLALWVQDGRRKIILKAKSEEVLMNLFQKVQAEGYIVNKIYDYGFNHFDGLTLTGFVVYPTPNEIKSLKRVRLW